MNNLRKLLKNKKGFTLVEVIVVLVIIAILAAITLPALTGYIDEANEKAAIAEGRTAYAALQTMASLDYGTDSGYIDASNALTTGGEAKFTALTGLAAANLSGIVVNATSHEVTDFIYASDNYNVTYAKATGFSAAKKS